MYSRKELSWCKIAHSMQSFVLSFPSSPGIWFLSQYSYWIAFFIPIDKNVPRWFHTASPNKNRSCQRQGFLQFIFLKCLVLFYFVLNMDLFLYAVLHSLDVQNLNWPDERWEGKTPVITEWNDNLTQFSLTKKCVPLLTFYRPEKRG